MLRQAVLVPDPSAQIALHREGSSTLADVLTGDSIDVSEIPAINDGQEPLDRIGQVPGDPFVLHLPSVALSGQHSVVALDEGGPDGQEPHRLSVAKGGQVPLAVGTVVVCNELTENGGIGQEPFSDNSDDRSIQITEVLSPTFNLHNDCSLNAYAADFCPRLEGHQFVLGPGTGADDLRHVQEVQAGGVGHHTLGVTDLWNKGGVSNVCCDITVFKDVLPFHGESKIPDMLGVAPKQIQKISKLSDLSVTLPDVIFQDKVLPPPEHALLVNEVYTPDYFIALHNICSMSGMKGDGTQYECYTPNHIGARISLPHTKLKLDRWRYHLIGYENAELNQYLQFGFPLGLSAEPELTSKTRNHGSAYTWYKYVDKFIATEVKECGVSGPVSKAPWQDMIISPLMTANKKPLARRTVFDASYGDGSLNGATPTDTYMGEATKYTYPKIEDYRIMILKAGRGSFMWKRDLARFYLQLPLDPVEYSKVAFVWRGLVFFFVSLAFGLRHSGLQGQRVTDAVSWIFRRLGLESSEDFYQVCNYVDDLGGVEETLARALEAFRALGNLLDDLGLQESVKKAVAPTQVITYLGVKFNTITMEMSVPPEKLSEVKEEIRRWQKKTTISKRELQSLLGKLFWVSKVIRYARAFMSRLLGMLRSMSDVKEGKKMVFCSEAKKDIRWWGKYLEEFNGVTMIFNEDPIPLSYEQLLDTPRDIMASDATPTGSGAWYDTEYWSEPFPHFLQDPQIPIHQKEFWALIVAAKLWGDQWSGRSIVLFCDNDSVVETIEKRKPRDPMLASLLREFLFIVVRKKFHPIVRKIESKRNEIADFLSRRYDVAGARDMFAKFGIRNVEKVVPKPEMFIFTSNW